MNEHSKALLKLFEQMAYMHTTREVFKDFIEMSVISISNSVDYVHRDEREKQYLTLIKKYDSERQKLFPEALAILVEALEYETVAGTPSDVLGTLFMDFKLNDKGQFFTPQHVCTMMGKMTLSENDENITKKGFVTVSDPCCGAGAMVLGFAQAMKEYGYNYTRQMIVTAVDTDIKCVHMCYLQLALYGIPAIVVHGDSLTVKEWSHWYTPIYMLDGWLWKTQQQTAEPETSPKVPDVSVHASQEPTHTYEQLTIFDVQGKED